MKTAIIVVLIGIIALLAWPQYQQYQRRQAAIAGYRSDQVEKQKKIDESWLVLCGGDAQQRILFRDQECQKWKERNADTRNYPDVRYPSGE